MSSCSSKRNGGMPDECRGRYDTAIFTTLDNICEDCYNLYKEPDIHSMCRSAVSVWNSMIDIDL